MYHKYIQETHAFFRVWGTGSTPQNSSPSLSGAKFDPLPTQYKMMRGSILANIYVLISTRIHYLSLIYSHFFFGLLTKILQKF